MKTLFSQLDPAIQVQRCTKPQRVSFTINPDEETHEQKIKRYQKISYLPKNIKHKLASSETSQKIQSIGQKYNFELLRLANITRLVREYYFGEVRLEDFPREIEKRMNVSLLTAQEIARYVKAEIIDWDPYAEFLATLPKLPIREALKKYPAIGEQEISSGYLEIKGRDDLFDGTIRNWINDYILHLGQERHGTIDRTSYLFHSENAKNLASPERGKLGIILKSFDENTPLPVDAENNEVVLEVSEPRTAAGNQYQRPAPIAKITAQSQTPAKDNFIKPYPHRPKPAVRPQQIQRNETPREKEIIEGQSGSPLVVKDYVPRQNIPGVRQPPRRVAPQAKPPVPFSKEPPSQQFVRHPKNIIEPIGRSHPEPKIEGNTVDLRGDQEAKN